MRKLALIDADSIIYILGWHNKENEDEAGMKLQVADFMQNLVIQTGATHYVGAFSSSPNFRHRLYPAYKATRGEAPDWLKYWKPKIVQQCIEEFGFFKAEDMEADDVLSILRGDDVVYCSPDKDLRQIPGKHYDYSKKEWHDISTEEAEYRFWMQMLTGDTSDNIPGCKGIGPKKAEAIIQRGMTNNEMWGAVYKTYTTNKKYKDEDEARDMFLLMRELLKLMPPSANNVMNIMDHIQEVAYSVPDLNIENDGVLPTDQRPHEDDILRLASDLSQQV